MFCYRGIVPEFLPGERILHPVQFGANHSWWVGLQRVLGLCVWFVSLQIRCTQEVRVFPSSDESRFRRELITVILVAGSSDSVGSTDADWINVVRVELEPCMT